MAADETIRAYKGRLLQPQDDRRFVLSALRAVDFAVIAPVNTERPWADCFPVIEEWKPQIWALGPDDPREDEKRLWAMTRGIVAVKQDAPKPYSTTALIEWMASGRTASAVPYCERAALLAQGTVA